MSRIKRNELEGARDETSWTETHGLEAMDNGVISCHYLNLLIIQISCGYELDNEKGVCGGKCENLGVEEIQKAVKGRILNTSDIRFGIMTDKTTPYPA